MPSGGLRRQGAGGRAVAAAAGVAVHAARAAAMLLLLAPIALVIFLSFGADSYSTHPAQAAIRCAGTRTRSSSPSS